MFYIGIGESDRAACTLGAVVDKGVQVLEEISERSHLRILVQSLTLRYEFQQLPVLLCDGTVRGGRPEFDQPILRDVEDDSTRGELLEWGRALLGLLLAHELAHRSHGGSRQHTGQ